MAVAVMAIANNLAFQGQEAAYTTTSTTLVFTGTGVILTPKTSGTVRVVLDAIVSDNTAAVSVNLNINYETGTALVAAGGAVAGTAVMAAAVAYESVLANAVNYAHIEYQITGLTLNTSYIFEPVFGGSAAGTASFTQIDMWVEEI